MAVMLWLSTLNVLALDVISQVRAPSTRYHLIGSANRLGASRLHLMVAAPPRAPKVSGAPSFWAFCAHSADSCGN